MQYVIITDNSNKKYAIVDESFAPNVTISLQGTEPSIISDTTNVSQIVPDSKSIFKQFFYDKFGRLLSKLGIGQGKIGTSFKIGKL